MKNQKRSIILEILSDVITANDINIKDIKDIINTSTFIYIT